MSPGTIHLGSTAGLSVIAPSKGLAPTRDKTARHAMPRNYAKRIGQKDHKED